MCRSVSQLSFIREGGESWLAVAGCRPSGRFPCGDGVASQPARQLRSRSAWLAAAHSHSATARSRQSASSVSVQQRLREVGRQQCSALPPAVCACAGAGGEGRPARPTQQHARACLYSCPPRVCVLRLVIQPGRITVIINCTCGSAT